MKTFFTGWRIWRGPGLRRLALVGLLAAVLLFLVGAPPAQAGPLDQSAEQMRLVELVNALRAEYGLPPYRINPALMVAAQRHSEWAAMMGTHSHTGVGGSTPTDRAIAAGYGEGRAVRVSENIYWGTRATPELALQWWRNSDIHFRGMTSTQYLEIGTGAASGAGGSYYTLKFGVVTGDAPAVSAPGPAPPGAQATRPVYRFVPVEVAEPREDGSVVHVVDEGQNLSYISDAYDVAVSEIMALNRLNERSIIRPGDELIIVPAPVQPAPELVGPLYHTVEAGQTLFGIALTYGVTLDQVLSLNGLQENTIIRPGDELLVIPDPDAPTPTVGPLYHRVQEGQTLLGIAGWYGITLDTLLGLNGLSPTSLIYPGDQLLIRPGDPTATPLPPTPLPPSATPPPTSAVRASPTPAATPEAADPEPRTGSARQAVSIGVIAIGVLGAGLILAGLIRR